jgi:hypothetical protein
MYGNLLGYDYQRFSGLVTDNTWFKNIWELSHDFNIYASFGPIISYIRSAKAIAHLWNFFHAITVDQTSFLRNVFDSINRSSMSCASYYATGKQSTGNASLWREVTPTYTNSYSST